MYYTLKKWVYLMLKHKKQREQCDYLLVELSKWFLEPSGESRCVADNLVWLKWRAIIYTSRFVAIVKINLDVTFNVIGFLTVDGHTMWKIVHKVNGSRTIIFLD